MTAAEVCILSDRLIPVPKEIRFEDGPDYLIRNSCPVQLNVWESAQVREETVDCFKTFWNAVPEIVLTRNRTAEKMNHDAYKINVTENELSITARSLNGVRNALKTLRQLAEVIRGTEKVSGYILVQCMIHDEPAMPFRSIHLCIFPETSLWDIEKQIRLAAYYKFNYAVIETWGVFPFESHPEFCWADRKIDKAELRRLILLGKKLGITLVPQLNLLGHASASRASTGKHAVLDFNPALQPLFEPEGWAWCISNPETRRIQTDLVSELYDFYDRPPFFHIGCDEADSIAVCRECRRRVLKDLLRDHIVYFHDLLRERGARIIMWHDMLLERHDKRWYGYVANALPKHEISGLYKELPHDIIIADWQYGYKAKEDGPEPEWPTSKFFKNEKFDVIVCPWSNFRGTKSLGQFAAQEHLTGLLATTWHTCHGEQLARIYSCAAHAAWNPAADRLGSLLPPSFHMRQTGWDMGIREYEKTGFCQNQVDPGHHPHPVS